MADGENTYCGEKAFSTVLFSANGVLFSANGATFLSKVRQNFFPKCDRISFQSATELDNNINGRGSKINQYEALPSTAGCFPHNKHTHMYLQWEWLFVLTFLCQYN